MYPRDLAERLKERAGQKFRPSNGFEGDIFYDNWCAGCTRDAAHRADPDHADGCPILAATFAYDIGAEKYPAEWQYGTDGQPKCTAFTGGEVPYRCPETGDLFASCADRLNPTVALCQDCLRILPLASLFPSYSDPPGLCPACGGQTCSCESCMADANNLWRGRFDLIGVKPWLRVIAWSEADGATTLHVPSKLERAKGYGPATWREGGYTANSLGTDYLARAHQKGLRRRLYRFPKRRFLGRDYWFARDAQVIPF